jgi:ankyrin repeat protein
MHVKRAIGVGWLLLRAADWRGRQRRPANAIRAGDRAAIVALSQDRAAINARAADGTTALHWAVQADALDVVRLLPATPMPTPRTGTRTPLALAATNGSAGMVERCAAEPRERVDA